VRLEGKDTGEETGHTTRGGGIAERGTYDELMENGGWYARMYQLQMGNGERG